MRKAILFVFVICCALLSTTQCFAADWKKAGTTTAGNTYYVDMKSIRVVEGPAYSSDVYFSVRVIYGSKDRARLSAQYKQQVATSVEVWAVSFREFFIAKTSQKIYNTSGSVIYKHSTNDLDYTEIQTGTIEERIADMVGKKIS